MNIKQIAGQISLFEEKPVNAKNECLGEPCAYCDVEWCSIACFKRRGYEWDSFHRFIKGSDNKPLRRNIETRIVRVNYFHFGKSSDVQKFNELMEVRG